MVSLWVFVSLGGEGSLFGGGGLVCLFVFNEIFPIAELLFFAWNCGHLKLPWNEVASLACFAFVLCF